MTRAWLVCLVGCGFHGPAVVPDTRDGAIDAVDAIDAPAGPAVAHRKPITIHGARVTGTVMHFPVWIALTDDQIAARAHAGGSDIFFTTTTGEPLDYELRWDQATHTLRAWVRLPMLQAGTDTTIEVEYGDPAKNTTSPNPAGVFKANFAAVWHLDDSLATTTIAEATGLVPGTAMNLTTTAQVVGKLGGAIDFDGTSDNKIAFTSPFPDHYNGAHTFSAWVNEHAMITHPTCVLLLGAPATDQSRLYFAHNINYDMGSQPPQISLYSDDWYAPSGDIGGQGWSYLVWTYAADRTNHLYLNGVDLTGSGISSTNMANTAAGTGYIGFAPRGPAGSATWGPNDDMDGQLDEVRIAAVVRPANWIAIEYANQNSPSTFYAVGPEELAP